MWKILFIVLAILYALNPFDILPDVIIGWGWLDDIAILGLLWHYLHTQKKKRKALYESGQGRRSGSEDSGGKAHSQGNSGTDSDSGGYHREWNPYQTLGIDRSASAEDIKRAYRRLAGKYHPDKVAHLGDEFKALAELRFKDIQKAYDELKN